MAVQKIIAYLNQISNSRISQKVLGIYLDSLELGTGFREEFISLHPTHGSSTADTQLHTVALSSFCHRWYGGCKTWKGSQRAPCLSLVNLKQNLMSYSIRHLEGGKQEVDQALGLTVSHRDQERHRIARGPPSTSHSSHSTTWISINKQCMQVAETRLRLPESFFPLDTQINSHIPGSPAIR